MYRDYMDTPEYREYARKLNKGGKKYPCPTCGRPEMLTLAEKKRGYQCNGCADKAEGIGWDY